MTAAPDTEAAPDGAAIEDRARQPNDSVRRSYVDRWKWLKAMLASSMTNGEKVFCVAVFEAMDRRTGIATRLHATLAQATGMEASTIKALDSGARQKGWIQSEGKGGHYYDENGKKVPLAKRFYISQPAITIAACDGASSDENDSKGRSESEQVAIKSGARGDQDRYNTPLSSPSSSPISSPANANNGNEEDVNSEVSFDLEEESPSTSSIHLDMAAHTAVDESLSSVKSSTSPTDDARAGVLPVARMEMRSAWGDRWPTDDKMALSAPTMGHAWANVAEQCWFAMGYDLADSRARRDETGQQPYDFIRERLQPEWVDEIARQMVAGELKVATLANLMAYVGFEPKPMCDVSERVEKAG